MQILAGVGAPVALNVDFLVIAGGGSGGGQYQGGGGGAGGTRCTVDQTGGLGTLETVLSLLPSTNYTVTVGAGGPQATGTGNNGSNSVFSTITENPHGPALEPRPKRD